jgi:N-acetylglucosaminyl-diphospho-decaprenol L-rhamnosyltransferase
MSHGSRLSEPLIVVSVVSHRQGELVHALLDDIDRHCTENIQVVLTLNLPESLPFEPGSFKYPVRVIRNERPKGFGANHNFAFRQIGSDYFCVANPDIRLDECPFRKLRDCFSHTDAALAGPLVLSPQGNIEDNARRFPTPLRIAGKIIARARSLDYPVGDQPIRPDWLAGMFLLFRSGVFEEVNGFDERYFLYYEDVDICARVRLAGREIALCPHARVVHHARRESHRNWRYLLWHVTSMLRFFCSGVFWRLAAAGLLGGRRPILKAP